MSLIVSFTTVAARKLAAVRRKVAIGGVGAAWRPALDKVWDFLRRSQACAPTVTTCISLFTTLARAAPTCRWMLDFELSCATRFEPKAKFMAAETPAGEAAVAVHVGSYDRMKRPHDAIHACAARRTTAPLAGTSWEIYSDWSDDPAKLEPRLCIC